jgi:hypothetical protein
MQFRELAIGAVSSVLALGFSGGVQAQDSTQVEMTDAQMEELVHRSYQYVAMFNVNNKFALVSGVNALGTDWGD